MDDFRKINAELAKYSAELGKRPQIIALNKADVDDSRVEDFKKQIKGHKIFVISGATRQGIDELLAVVAAELKKLPRIEAEKVFSELEEKTDPSRFEIKVIENKFVVTGQFVDNLIRGVVLSDAESNAYFQRRLVESGVIAAMRAKGMKDGDTVCIADIEFEWVD